MKKYAIISNKKRNELIARVAQNGQSVSRVAKQLRMKLPSAKSILRTYKKSGRVFDKKRVINRGIKSKKGDQSETQHQNSLQHGKISRSEQPQNIEPEQNGQEEVKIGGQLTMKQESFCPQPSKTEATVEQLLKYQYYLQVCLNQQITYYNTFMNYYKIPQFSINQK